MRKPWFVPPELFYYLATYARLAHRVTEDPKEQLDSHTHTTHRILQGFMESVAVAIQDGSSIKHEDEGVYIDLFRIPQWFYDEVAKGKRTDSVLS